MGSASKHLIRRSIYELGRRFHEIGGSGHALVYVGLNSYETVQALRSDDERKNDPIDDLTPNVSVPPIRAEYHSTLSALNGQDIEVVVEVYEPIQAAASGTTKPPLAAVRVNPGVDIGVATVVRPPRVTASPITPPHEGKSLL